MIAKLKIDIYWIDRGRGHGFTAFCNRVLLSRCTTPIRRPLNPNSREYYDEKEGKETEAAGARRWAEYYKQFYPYEGISMMRLIFYLAALLMIACGDRDNPVVPAVKVVADDEVKQPPGPNSGSDVEIPPSTSYEIPPSFADPPETAAQTTSSSSSIKLVGNSFSGSGGNSLSSDRRQDFTTGTSDNGWILTSVKLYLVTGNKSATSFTVEIWSTNGDALVKKLGTLTHPSSYANQGSNTFTGDVALAADITYAVVVDASSGNYGVGHVHGDATSESGETGWSIADHSYARTQSRTGTETWDHGSSEGVVYKMEVHGYEAPSPPSSSRLVRTTQSQSSSVSLHTLNEGTIDRRQDFTVGESDHGWRLTSVKLEISSGSGAANFTVGIWSTNGDALVTKLGDLSPPSPFSSGGFKDFTGNIGLDANTIYAVVVDVSGSSNYKIGQLVNRPNDAGEDGWSIADHSYTRTGSATNWHKNTGVVYDLQVHGYDKSTRPEVPPPSEESEPSDPPGPSDPPDDPGPSETLSSSQSEDPEEEELERYNPNPSICSPGPGQVPGGFTVRPDGTVISPSELDIGRAFFDYETCRPCCHMPLDLVTIDQWHNYEIGLSPDGDRWTRDEIVARITSIESWKE